MTNKIAALIVALAATLCARAQDVERAGRWLDTLYQQHPFYGNVLIARDGNVMYCKSFGMADAPKGIALQRQHAFQIASVSKQFTAYGIMLLEAQGKVNYDSAVVRYLPWFPYRQITIRHLLTHTSGLPDFWNDIRPGLDTTQPNDNADVQAYLMQHQLPLRFEPGTRWEYCDIGYDFLANIIEAVSGKSYTRFMAERIFHPLRMKHTIAHKVTDIRRITHTDLVMGHVPDSSGRFVYAHEQPSLSFIRYLGNFYGDGSVVSVADDLLAYDQALYQHRLLPAARQEAAFTPFVPVSGDTLYNKQGKPIQYGFGWVISTDPRWGKIVQHSGSQPGFISHFVRLTDRRITIIYLSNTDTPAQWQIVPSLLDRL